MRLAKFSNKYILKKTHHMKLKKQDFSKKKNTKIVRAVLLVEKCTGLFSYQGNLYVAADHPVLEKKKQNK
jgi:hypothetical protein